MLHFLTGFEINKQDGSGQFLNFILSNGVRSKQKDRYYPTDYTHMLPEDAEKRIRSVEIFYGDIVYGFLFFDKNNTLLWKIGLIDSDCDVETVVLADNEIIIGVVAKLRAGYQSLYTDFQFQIGIRLD